MGKSLYSHITGPGVENQFPPFVSADIGSDDAKPEFGEELSGECDILRPDPRGRGIGRILQQIGAAKKFDFHPGGDSAFPQETPPHLRNDRAHVFPWVIAGKCIEARVGGGKHGMANRANMGMRAPEGHRDARPEDGGDLRRSGYDQQVAGR